jgi:uncharacterized protein YndB with AHSA1/START domain
MRVKEEIEVAAPPEAVFEWLVDRRLMARWCEALGRPASFADCLPEDRSAVRVGYRATVAGVARTSFTSRETVKVPATYEVTEYDPPWRLATRSTHPHAKATEVYELERANRGTRLRLEREIDYDGLAKVGLLIGSVLRPSAGLGFRRWVRKDARDSLEKLRELIEAG